MLVITCDVAKIFKTHNYVAISSALSFLCTDKKKHAYEKLRALNITVFILGIFEIL